METINDLLKALDNKVPASMAKRLDGLGIINQKLAVAREENKENPTEESQEKLDEIIEFIKDTQDDLIEDLSELVDKKKEAEARSRQIARNKANAEAKKIAEEEAVKANEEELKQKELLEKNKPEENPKNDPEKKSGIGWGGLVLGGVLLIVSAGAINYFGKKQ